MLVQPPPQNAATNPRPRPHYRVRLKQSWTDAWTTAPYLQAMRATDCAAPSCPRATFKWLAGNIKWEDQPTFAAQAILSGILDAFVMIELIPTVDPAAPSGTPSPAPIPLFVGRFYDESVALLGASAGSAADQEIIAYGLQHELDRETLRGAWATNDGAAALQIKSNLTFNEKFIRGFREVGNRSAAKMAVNGNNTYVFATALDASGNSYPWTVLDIVNYLLACFGPASVPFAVSGQTDILAATTLPRIAVHHQSVFEMLNELIDRRKGLSWSIRTNGAGTVELHIATVFDQAVTFDSATVAANAERQTVDLTQFPPSYASEVRVDYSSLNRYGTIVVAGEPVVSCFTASFADHTLVEGWTAAKATEYDAAAGAAAPRDADRERNSPRLGHVYSTFKIPAAWNWMAGGGEGKNGMKPACPLFSDGGRSVSNSNAPTRTWGQTLLRSLPVPKDQADLANPDGLEPEYLEPMAFLWSEKDQAWTFAHEPGGGPGENAGANVRVLDHDFGVEVKFHPNHKLALNHFVTANNGGSAAPSDHLPAYDYKKLIVTVAARTDARIEVAVTIPGVDPARVLQIYVEDAEVWWMCENTVVDVQGGALQRITQAGVSRDDSPRLRQIAALAKVWFGTIRAKLDLTVTDLLTQYAVGSLVLDLVDASATTPINSLVSEVTWDLDAMTTSLRTDFAELDFRAFGGHGGKTTIH